VILTGANRNDVTQLQALVEAIPPISGKRGRPLSKPRIVQGDRGYDHDKYRRPLHAAGIATEIARRGEPHGSGLGKTRWVVERTISWLHNFRRLRIRFERLAFIHEAFMKIACCIICWRKLKNSLEGSHVAFRKCGPRRTVRASFPAYGSSAARSISLMPVVPAATQPSLTLHRRFIPLTRDKGAEP
jgi:transposase